jgi:hypothetical protein
MTKPEINAIQDIISKKQSSLLPKDTRIVNGPDGPIGVVTLTERERQIIIRSDDGY